MIDTHSHIYDSAFDADRQQAVERALECGVTHILMPAIDSQSHDSLFDTAARYPGVCLPMIGLHPTSVNGNPDYERELDLVAGYLANPPVERFYAVGEVGLDLYWSKDFFQEQALALRFQAELSIEYDLPLVLHCRDAWSELFEVLAPFKGMGLRGVMHSFSGSYEHYTAARELGDFVVGIGGVVTYRKSLLPELLPKLPLEHIVLETDAPYLPPVPHRGERNQSSYIPIICAKVAEIVGLPQNVVAARTTENAKRIFRITE